MLISRDRRPGVAAGVALLAVYITTLAPGLTFWDSGEFLAAIHSLGIPHPPGTPLYVLTANVWAGIFGPVFGFARAVNLFSAVCGAGACALLADLFVRWTQKPVAAFSAALCAGLTSSLWLTATETEVYAPALLVACLLLWIADRSHESGDTRWWILFAYVAGLGWSLHLTALIVVPAAAFLALRGSEAKLTIARVLGLMPLLIAGGILGASAVAFLYVRAHHDPAINQGNPSTFAALSDVIARRQYGVAGLWPRRAPLLLQFGNVFEWADWQFALGLDSRQPPSLLRTPFTVVFALLGGLGSFAHRRLHRRSWFALSILLFTAYAGVVVYLNLRAGPSYGAGVLDPAALHEARERDYFFLLVWVCWGLWAGFGAHALAAKIFRRQAFAANGFGLLVAAAPLFLNWRAVDRSNEPRASEARIFASRVLSAAPMNSVVLARGDNDTYPVWYLREVERLRPDVIPVTVPMLPAQWYRAELSRRHGLVSRDLAMQWKGTEATLRSICANARVQYRTVVGPVSLSDSLLRPAC